MAITYTDKVQLTPNANPIVNQWRAVDANEVKTVVNANETALGLKAPLASPTFTGVPAAPTAALGTDTTQLATTEFVQDALNANIVSITGATSLDATAYGKVHVCTGTSSNYTVDLPTAVGNSGRGLVIKGANTLTRTVTVAGSSGQTIDGESSRQLSTSGMMNFMSDGSNWVVVAEAGSWVPYTPVLGGFSADPTISKAAYFRVGKMVIVHFFTSSNGTSSAATKTITVPFNSKAAVPGGLLLANTNNGVIATGNPGLATMRLSSTTVDIFRDFAATNWTASGNCRFSVILNYEME